MSAESECLALLKARDPDRHLATLYLPAGERRAVAAIYAFNAEVARIPALAREPEAGAIRLRWWRDALVGGEDNGSHPVASELRRAIGEHGLPMAAFERYLEARLFDLYADPMPDVATLEGYCGETASALLQLACMVCGTRDAADACGHGGVAQACAYLARAAGAHRAAGRCYIPPDMLLQAGLNAGSWQEEAPDGRHLAAVGRLTEMSRHHLRIAAGAIARLPRERRAPFLPLAAVQPLLRRTEKAGLALFREMPDISPLRRNWAVASAALTGLRFA